MKDNQKVYGYVRVSSKDQNEDRQLKSMCDFGIPKERIFLDKQSGKDFNRAEYQKWWIWREYKIRRREKEKYS